MRDDNDLQFDYGLNRSKGWEAQKESYIAGVVGLAVTAITNSGCNLISTNVGVTIDAEARITISGAIGFFVMGHISNIMRRKKNKNKILRKKKEE